MKLSNEDARNWQANPKFKISSVALKYATFPLRLIGASRSNICYDKFGRQQILVLKPDMEPKWRKIEFATSHLESPEIVIAQISIDTSSGELTETLGSGDFKCWLEQPSE